MQRRIIPQPTICPRYNGYPSQIPRIFIWKLVRRKHNPFSKPSPSALNFVNLSAKPYNYLMHGYLTQAIDLMEA